MTVKQIQHALQQLGTTKKAQASAWFFKTGQGEYAEGDQFHGVTVPEQRKIAKKNRKLPLTQCIELLHSPWHEDRLVALFILVDKFQHAPAPEQREIVRLYLRNTKCINNWDLVDSSAHKILGEYLYTTKKSIKRLKVMAKSRLVWDRRIAIISTYAFILHGDPKATLFIARFLQRDQHDLIHKAVGWMLREVGKRCLVADEEIFLKEFAATMPRTMLRYAIEHFPKARQRYYLGLAKT
ncbi:MAG: hypothetical protein ACD_41C00177G0003 [uncultured bacterium]|nr:MAG: hypothetical protein ACD_41C00177G0003 [uncultured bacterium]